MMSNQQKQQFADMILQYIAEEGYLSPEDLFEEDVLDDWAKDNGYVKKDEKE